LVCYETQIQRVILKSPPFHPLLSQFNSVHTFRTNFSEVHFIIVLYTTGFLKWPFILRFSNTFVSPKIKHTHYMQPHMPLIKNVFHYKNICILKNIHQIEIHIIIKGLVTKSLKDTAQLFICLLKAGNWRSGSLVPTDWFHLQLPASWLSALGPQISANIINNINNTHDTGKSVWWVAINPFTPISEFRCLLVLCPGRF
jgi:hypothetical protein